MVVDLTTQTSVEITRFELPTPFAVGTVNAYLLRNGSTAVLLDCGLNYDPAREKLLASLAEQGLEPQDITALVLTHGHVDHVGLTSLFRSAGVPVYAHSGVSTWLEPGGEWDHYRGEFFQSLYQTMGVPQEWIDEAIQEFFLLQKWNDRSVVDEAIEPGDHLSWFPNFEVVHVPGHAQAAIALWSEATGDIFTGDQLLPKISSNAIIEPDMTSPSGKLAVRTRSLLQYRTSLLDLARLPIRRVLPGHGAPFTGVKELIEKRIEAQSQRKKQFLQLVKQKPGSTAYELAIEYFPNHRHQLSLIMSETIGFLDWLVEDGVVVSMPSKTGVLSWHAQA